MLHFAFVTAVWILLGAAEPGPGWSPAASTPRTWILQLEGDARGIEVRRATVRSFEFRAPRGPAGAHRVVSVDVDGAVLATVSLDLSAFCLDPAHVDEAPHLDGCVLTAHVISTIVKVPVVEGVAELRIEALRDGLTPRLLGRISRQQLDSLAAVTEGPQDRKEVR